MKQNANGTCWAGSPERRGNRWSGSWGWGSSPPLHCPLLLHHHCCCCCGCCCCCYPQPLQGDSCWPRTLPHLSSAGWTVPLRLIVLHPAQRERSVAIRIYVVTSTSSPNGLGELWNWSTVRWLGIWLLVCLELRKTQEMGCLASIKQSYQWKLFIVQTCQDALCNISDCSSTIQKKNGLAFNIHFHVNTGIHL